MNKLEIANKVHERLMVGPKTPIAELLVDSRCEVGFQQVNELVGANGIFFVGPLPASVQKTTVLAAGVPVNAPHAAAGKVLTVSCVALP